MGQRNQRAALGNDSNNSTESRALDERIDTFAAWPGLETQLELSYTCLDLEEEGQLPYSSLEPVLRHHLMQAGLIEFIAQFALPDGRLDETEISAYVKAYKLNLTKPLTLDNWKNLVLAWIRRCEDAQKEQIEIWEESNDKMRSLQAREYQLAMKNFQQHYVDQLEAYYKAIDEVHRKEDEYRHEWEANMAIQNEFYNTQMQYLQERNEEALDHFNRQLEVQADIRAEYMRHLKTKSVRGPNNITTITYAYPATLTETGAPISGGAQIPFRKYYSKKSRRKGIC